MGVALMRLDANDMTFRVKGCAVIDGVSCHVAPGELVGLIGPNGAGKSTLLKSIVGLLPHAEGTVLLDGRPIAALSDRERARTLAYLPQERHVEWGLDGRSVVMLGRYPHRRGFGGPSRACRQAVEDALAEVGAGGLADRPFSVMSGGERARILLARALCLGAPLLLADEPITALDPYHQIQVMTLLKRAAARGMGVLVVMHDLTLASRFMDRLILMDGGCVVAEGPPHAVLTPANMTSVYRVSTVFAGDEGHRAIVPWDPLPQFAPPPDEPWDGP